MSKKNKNSNVNTEAVDQVNEVPAEASVVEEVVVEEKTEEVKKDADPVEEAPAPVEEKAEEVSVEEPKTEEVAPVKEKVEEVKEPEPVPVAEEPAPDVTKAVPVEEGEGTDDPFDYFVQLNKEPFTDEKLAMVEERLAKYELAHFVSADGLVLVGPYLTKDGAINGRRLVIRCGLKGEIVTIPKD